MVWWSLLALVLLDEPHRVAVDKKSGGTAMNITPGLRISFTTTLELNSLEIRFTINYSILVLFIFFVYFSYPIVLSCTHLKRVSHYLGLARSRHFFCLPRDRPTFSDIFARSYYSDLHSEIATRNWLLGSEIFTRSSYSELYSEISARNYLLDSDIFTRTYILRVTRKYIYLGIIIICSELARKYSLGDIFSEIFILGIHTRRYFTRRYSVQAEILYLEIFTLGDICTRN